MLPTGTSEGAAGAAGATTLLLVATVLLVTAAAADLLRTHRREGSAGGGAAGPGAARRPGRGARTLLALVLVDVWVLAAVVLQLADAASRPLLVGLVYGVVGCTSVAAAVVALVLLARGRGGVAEVGAPPVEAPSATRTLASVSGPRGLGGRAPRPLADRPATAGALAVVAPPVADHLRGADEPVLGTSGARGGARERAAAAARRREERERGRGRQRRETVTAVETVLGRHGRTLDPAPPRPASAPPTSEPWFERTRPGSGPGPLAPRSSSPAAPTTGPHPGDPPGTGSEQRVADPSRTATSRGRPRRAAGGR